MLAAALSGCVSLPGEERPAAAPSLTGDAGFPRLDPGAQHLDSLHFQTFGYGAEKTQRSSETAERLYGRIMADTGLYSFMPRQLYPLIVYASQEEFIRKSGMPDWSGGVAVGRALYMPDGPQFHVTLAHEMTHLIFNEFMGRTDAALRWINEGLAVYEEEEERGGVLRSRAVSRAMPFRDMANLAPIGEKDSLVSDWYGQVGSVTRFLIERGGRVGFGEFLKSLRDGRSFDDAVRTGFPGTWAGADTLEAAWNANR